MVQATTPTFVLTLPQEVDLSQAENVYFTVSQGMNVLTKTGDSLTIDENVVSVFLSQTETLAFSVGSIELQLNWTYQNGERACTKIKTVEVDKNLLKKVVE